MKIEIRAPSRRTDMSRLAETYSLSKPRIRRTSTSDESRWRAANSSVSSLRAIASITTPRESSPRAGCSSTSMTASGGYASGRLAGSVRSSRGVNSERRRAAKRFGRRSVTRTQTERPKHAAPRPATSTAQTNLAGRLASSWGRCASRRRARARSSYGCGSPLRALTTGAVAWAVRGAAGTAGAPHQSSDGSPASRSRPARAPASACRPASPQPAPWLTSRRHSRQPSLDMDRLRHPSTRHPTRLRISQARLNRQAAALCR